MSTLLLTVSGCSGGNQGPLGIYQLFPDYCRDLSITVVNVETIPNSIEANVSKVFETIQRESNSFNRIYLMGYSMGGAVVAQVAKALKDAGDDRLAGIALLSTQTEGLKVLKDLNVPLLFYHGREDGYFPLWQIEGYFSAYKGKKRFVQLNHLGHDLSPIRHRHVSRSFTNQLAQDVIIEISSFFQKDRPEKDLITGEVVTKNIPPTILDRLMRVIHSFWASSLTSATLPASSMKNC